MTPEPSVFEMLARSRREWLAQGALAAALLSPGGHKVRRRVLERTQRRELLPLVRTVPSVREERPTEEAWRADIELSWDVAKRPVCLELKLDASLSRAQTEAHHRGRIDGWVVPRGRIREFKQQLGEDVRLLTWEELAQLTDVPVLEQLLEEAGASGSLMRDALTLETARREFEAFLSPAPVRRWPALYGFLIALDAHLAEQFLPHEYERSPAPAQTPESGGLGPYYGFTFVLRTGRQSRPYWYGFAQDGEGDPRLYLEDRQTAAGRLVDDIFRWPLDAGATARRFARKLRVAVVTGRGRTTLLHRTPSAKRGN